MDECKGTLLYSSFFLFKLVNVISNIEGQTGSEVADVLIFMSGSNSVPSLGFPIRPNVTFIHRDRKLCTASTCDITLRLPTVHDTYEAFKEAITLSIVGNDGLGGGV